MTDVIDNAGRLRVVAVNGSPRGKHSVTIRFMRCCAKARDLDLIEVAAGRDTPQALQKAVDGFFESAATADALVWAYPVYTSGVPSQFQAFLERVCSDSRQSTLAGKPALQVLSSKHFFDTTAMAYMAAVSADLGLVPCGEYSGDPDDLMSQAGRNKLLSFWDQALGDMADACRWSRAVKPDSSPGGKRILVLTDESEARDEAATSLNKVLAALSAQLVNPVIETIDISRADLKGGCLGCLSCVIDGMCVYKDGYGRLIEKVLAADAVIYTQRMEGRWFRSIWKRYDDRIFRFGHRLTMAGKPLLFIVGGDLSTAPWLRDVIESRAKITACPACGILETGSGSVPDELVRLAAGHMARRLATGGYSPVTFWEKGGMRIFRDLVFEMRGFMRADHRFYRKRGYYDFPHKRVRSILRGYLAGAAMSIPAFKRVAMPKLLERMSSQYDAAIAKPR